MEFKKCVRCGCFFASDNDTCCNCTSKDHSDIVTLRAYFDDNATVISTHQLSLNTGITVENLNRYLQIDEFSTYTDMSGNTNKKNKDNGNLGIF